MFSSQIITILLILLVISFIITPFVSMRMLGKGTVKIVIGVLFLFFFNVFGGLIGLHIPINIFTVIVSSFLGLFGIVSLAAIHIFVL